MHNLDWRLKLHPILLKFKMYAYQHFNFEAPYLQKIWKLQKQKVFTYRSEITFTQECTSYLSKRPAQRLNKTIELDESTARRQLKSPRSLSGRSIHLTLVTKWSWSWSWMTYCHPLCAMSIALPFWESDKAISWSMVKVMCVVKGKVTFDLQNSKVKVIVKVKPIGHIWGLEFNRYVCFSFRGNRTIFWLRYSKFYIWPWKFNVKVMAKGKPDGHFWALEFNRYVCFSFRGNRTIFGWDIAYSIFDLEKSRSRSRPKSTKI